MLREIFIKIMKSNTTPLVLSAILVLTGMASSYAAVATPGNLVIGFRAETGTVGTSNNVLIDLGAATDITTSTRNSYDLSGPSSIMSTTYGANWWTREDLYYGVISYNGYEINDGNDYYQNFSSTRLNNSPAISLDNAADVYNSQAVFQQFQLNTPDTALASGTVTGITRGGSSFMSEYLSIDNADSGSWGSLSTAGWGALFIESQDNLVTSFTSFQNGLGIYTAAGGLFDFQQSITAAVYISNGTLVVVPEPSTYMLLGLSVVVLFFAIRRRKA